MLYLIKEYGKNNKEYLKIGKADNVNKRIQQYNTNCAEFELIDTFEGSLPEESLLHSFLEKYKIKGEWMEYNDEILLLWKLYKEIRPKIKENIITTGEYIRKEFYDTQTKYYEEKIEEYKNEIYELKDCFNRYGDLEKKIDEIPDTYSECLELLKFTLKIIPIEYRKQLRKEFEGKLKYFTFKEEI